MEKNLLIREMQSEMSLTNKPVKLTKALSMLEDSTLKVITPEKSNQISHVMGESPDRIDSSPGIYSFLSLG